MVRNSDGKWFVNFSVNLMWTWIQVLYFCTFRYTKITNFCKYNSFSNIAVNFFREFEFTQTSLFTGKLTVVNFNKALTSIRWSPSLLVLEKLRRKIAKVILEKLCWQNRFHLVIELSCNFYLTMTWISEEITLHIQKKCTETMCNFCRKI